MTAFLIILGIAAYLVGAYLDSYSSRPGKYFGLDEVNPLYRNKDKDYVLWKDAIVSSAVVAILILTGVSVDGGFAAVLGGMFGGGRSLAFVFNRQRQKKNRAVQIDFLTDLHNGEVRSYPYVTHRNGKAFFQLFRYLAAPEGDTSSSDGYYATQQRVIEAVLAEARLEPDQWFSGS
jgi:hypothetical protein